MTFNTIKKLKAANIATGHYWFSPGSMRAFNSRVYDPVYDGNFFVSSEKEPGNKPRLYTVCYLDKNGCVQTKGNFQDFSNLTTARNAAHLASMARAEGEK